MNKKAVALPWEVVVSGILIILVGGIALFFSTDAFGKGKDTTDKLSSCKGQNGQCTTKEACEGRGGTAIYGVGCPDDESSFEGDPFEEGLSDEAYCCVQR